MPTPNFPPFANEPGATTQPRQLQRWLDVNLQGGDLGRGRYYLTLPTFSVNVNWIGVSDIVAAYNFEGPNNFSLSIGNIVGTGQLNTNIPNIGRLQPNYLLCVMWKDEFGNTHRYTIWNGVGEVIDFVLPLYSGQLIRKNFRLEVWSTNVATVSNTNTGIIFNTSVLQGVDYRYTSDMLLSGNDGEVTNFNDIASGNVPAFPALPLSGTVTAHWQSDHGIVGANWTSSDSNARVLHDFSTINLVPDIDLNYLSVPVNGIQLVTTDANYICIFVTMVIKFLTNNAGQVYTIGASQLNITTLDDNNVTLTLEDGTTTNTAPINKWLIISVIYAGGVPNNFAQIRIYPLNIQNTAGDSFEVTTTNPGGGVVINLSASSASAPYLLADFVIYNFYGGSSDAQLLLNYYYQKYNTFFNLPLTFPLNSSPTANII